MKFWEWMAVCVLVVMIFVQNMIISHKISILWETTVELKKVIEEGICD